MDLLEDILYYENESMLQTLLTLGLITAIVLTILICAVIVPASKEGKYTGFLKFVRDYFLTRKLWIEAILRFFYILFTMLYICMGVFVIFMGGYAIIVGLSMAIFGPIIVRIVYESCMIFILMLKNVMEINNNLLGNKAKESIFDLDMSKVGAVGQSALSRMASTTAAAANQMQNLADNTSNMANSSTGAVGRSCPKCGAALSDSAVFCKRCGTKVD